MSQVVKMLQAGRNDVQWLGSNIAELKQSYEGQFVAVKTGRVVAHSTSVSTLMRDLKRKKINAAGTIIKYVSSVREVL
jgi:hypothetical protein